MRMSQLKVQPEYELIDVEGKGSILIFIKEDEGGYEAYGVPLEPVAIVSGSDKEKVVEKATGLSERLIEGSKWFDKYS